MEDSPRFEPDKLESLSPVEGAGADENVAATKVQKVYRSYRTRRMLADSAIVVEELWWQALDLTRLSQSTVSFTELDASEVSQNLSVDGKALKLALMHWLEAIDPRHRYGHNLHFYYDAWSESQVGEPFFYWLDIGEGKYLNLPECPRAKLRKQLVRYLSPNEFNRSRDFKKKLLKTVVSQDLKQEREHYEYIINEGKIIHKQSGEPLDTSEGCKVTKWIFVLSTAKRLYAGKKKKGVFHHSSFLSGGAVIAAGKFTAKNGIIKYIWGDSGHYKPSAVNLGNFMNFLEENGVGIKKRLHTRYMFIYYCLSFCCW